MKKLLIPFFSLLLLSYESVAATDEQNANQLYVEAMAAIQLVQEDVAYDKFQTILQDYPGSTAAVLSVDIAKELEPLAFIQGVKSDRSKYPQSNFNAFLSSVISALESKDYAYFLAYLRSASPIDEYDFNRILSSVDEAKVQQTLALLKKLKSASEGASELVSEHPNYKRSHDLGEYTQYDFYLDGEISFVEKNGAFYMLE